MRLNSSLSFWSTAVLLINLIPTILSMVSLTYSSALTANNSHYVRYGQSVGRFYYEAIEVIVSMTGRYTLKSNSSKDLYGCLYNNSFYASNSSLNLLASDDDSGGGNQFFFNVTLQPNQKYILVVTTYGQNVTGSFSIIRSGTSGSITFNNITVVTSILTTTALETTSSESIVTSMLTLVTSDLRTTNTEACSRPRISLIPDSTSLNAPVQFQKLQDFYISSNIELKCPLSLSMLIKWTISNCTTICTNPISVDQSVLTTYSELFIPARTLDYGTYELKLTVTMMASTTTTSSSAAYVRITRSGITANLVQFGTSIITSGHQKDLILDPGKYSVDPDQEIFNASDWNYAYYCRPHDLYHSASSLSLQSIDQLNHQCFSNQSAVRNGTVIQYNTATVTKSLVTILAGALTANETYQFVVFMVNRRNASIRATGYLLVQVEDAKPQLIAVACVISTLCSPNVEYQFINPTTQVALFSICSGNCTSLMNITWNIYQGWTNASTDIVKRNLFTHGNSSDDHRFYGMDTSNFTATNDLFLENPEFFYWRFEVRYTFPLEISLSALNFRLNYPPENGSCSINPRNGTTSTLFNVICSDWFDEDGIKDYSFYTWNTDSSERLMLASTMARHSSLRLPAGDNKTSMINIVIIIRDVLNCITEYNLSSITVIADTKEIHSLVDVLQQTKGGIINTNPIIQLLAGGNQNTIGQILISISQVFNQIDNQQIERAVSSGVPATSISISPLGSSARELSSAGLNISALDDYKQLLNKHANVRDYLISYSTNLKITTPDSIKLQACTLAKMTEATNQLTRAVSILASNKCHQLSRALLSSARKIAFEEVQLTAKYIAQCATNVLTATNGPLQGRTSILDLDFNRANTLPDDYDTDLESEWAKASLFTDENDFSAESIQKGRYWYHQKQTANTIADQVAEINSYITAALNIHLNLGQKITMNASSVFVSVETVSRKSLANQLIKQVAGAQIRIPSDFNLTASDNTSISLRSMLQPMASYGSSSTSPTNSNLSTSISLSLLDQNGDAITIYANTKEAIELIIPRDPNVRLPSMTLANVTSLLEHNRSFYLHFVNISRTNNLSVSFHFQMQPLNRSLGYWFIFKFDYAPQLNHSIDGCSLFCPSNLTNDDLYTYFLDNQRTDNHQSIVFGLRELNETEMEYYCSNTSKNSQLPMTFDRPFNFSFNYAVRTYTSGCYYLDAANNWRSDGLIVGPLTNPFQTQCFSTHLTTFASAFLVLPAPINWNYIFTNGDFVRNKTIYITMISVGIIYLLLIIFARFKDKKDAEKLGITILPDNLRVDRYLYQITVFTGHRKDAGTESKVHFVLGGADDQTSIRTFADLNRKIFQRSGIDAFILAVPKSLGPLNYLRIWHDNTGQKESASWFLKYVIVRDLQTTIKTHFICQQWFAVEKDDGVIERLLPAAGEYQKEQLAYVLSKQAYYSVSESHLWFSIFGRPPASKFTRVQRCTCCFVLFCTVMLFNILYYDQRQEVNVMKNSGRLSLGSLHLTSEQIGIGVIVELLSLIPSLLLVQLFRRTRQRHSDQEKLSIFYETLRKIKRYPTSTVHSKAQKRPKFTFPRWCIFLAYSLSFIMVGLAVFFVIARGIEFGDLKTQIWLISLLVGFCSSICLTQPLKVICLAVFFAVFCRNTNNDREIAGGIDNDDDLDFANGREYIHSIEDRSFFIKRSTTRTDRLSKGEVDEARSHRVREIHMWSIIREALSYSCFLWIVYAIIYSSRNEQAFRQVNHLRQFFLNTRHADLDYTKIVSIKDYWNWLENSFISNIRAQQWYNGDVPRYLNGFIDDKSNRLIGWATMRQLRVVSHVSQEVSCQRRSIVRHFNLTCESDYSLLNEEQHSFQPGWLDHRTRNYSSTISNAFRYRSSQELDTYMYAGDHGTYRSGGYVYEFRGRLSDLRSNLSQLHQLGWIDQKSRAVIIQCTLYNPNAQMFTSVTLLAELLSTGSVIPTARFEPVNFQDLTSLFNLIIAIIYMIFIVYFMIVEIRSLFHLKCAYFRQFWSYLEWGIIGCSWTGVGVYVWRHEEISRIATLFRENKGSVYVNLQLANYVNDLLGFLLGFCCFFSTVKLLRFGRFNRRLSLLSETLRHAYKDLLSFILMMSIVFMAFLVLFYLLFASNIQACSTVLHTAQMLFEMILLKFDATEIHSANRYLGPLCFTVFIFFVVFIGMTIFISIISDSFRVVRKQSQLTYNEDHEIFAYMWKTFQRWTGMKKPDEWELYEEWDRRMRPEYYDPIERFPEKIDQLLEALNRIYLSQQSAILRENQP